MKKTYYKIAVGFIASVLISCGGKKKEAPIVDETPVATPESTLEIEKPQLKFGFIKLTDMAPLAIAKEKGFFEDEGLFVSVEAQSNWKNILDRVIDGQLDGSHMLAGQPIAAQAGYSF